MHLPSRFNIARARLDVLTVPEETTGEPYIERVPTGPWNQPFCYELLDAATGRFRLWSAGPDGTFGTEDDLVYVPPS